MRFGAILLAGILAAASAAAQDDRTAWRVVEDEFFQRGYDRAADPDGPALERIRAFRERSAAAVSAERLPRRERLDFLVLCNRLDRLLAWGELTRGAAVSPTAEERHQHHWAWEFGIDRTLAQVLEEALAVYRETEEEMERLARSVDAGLDRRAFDGRLKADHPDAGGGLAAARVARERPRRFTLERSFVTVPEYARDVRVRPGDPQSNTPYGHYWPTEDPRRTPGYYVVPSGGHLEGSALLQHLRGNNRPWTAVVAAHETIPGHHLQLAIAANDATRMRRTVYNSAFVEGWALYGEHVLARHGYFVTPEERFAQLKMRLWRAARVVADLGVHCAGLPRGDLEALLERGVGHEPLAARSELDRIRQSSSYYSGYFVGWTEIERLRRDCERAWGGLFNERSFHDALLSCGHVPFHVVRQMLLAE